MSNQRNIWGNVKETIGRQVGLCSTNDDLLNYYNEGVEYFWSLGDWVGKNQRWKFRVTSDCHGNRCVVYPREIETMEMMTICGRPIGIRNVFFEFLENASGPIGGGNNWNGQGYGGSCLTLVGDRQEVCTMRDFSEDSTLRIYTERIETAGTVILLGYDSSGNWIRTQDTNGVWRDGDYLNIAGLGGSGITSTKTFSKLTGVQLTGSPRAGNVYLYSVNSASEEKWLATCDYAVDIPVFRKSIIGGLRGRGAVDENDEQRCTCVTALVKMRFMPVINDTDYVQISSVSALKEIISYIYARDNGKLAEAAGHKQEAMNILNAQLTQYNGHGAKKIIQFGSKALLGTHSNVQ